MPAIARTGYGDLAAAVGISAAAFGIRLLIDPLVGSLQPFAPSFVAVAAAVWYWGPRAGLSTAVLCYLWGSVAFMDPRGSVKVLGIQNSSALISYFVQSLLIVVIGTKARTSRAVEARFRAAQEISLHPFTILRAVRDGAGVIQDFEWTFVNDAAGRALRTTPQELLGKRMLERFPGSRADVFPLYRRVLDSGQGAELEVEYRADGLEGWFRNMAVPLDDGVATSFVEITESKLLQRTLTDRDETKDRFLAVLAHELRQPLNAILMAVHSTEGPRAERVTQLLDRQVTHLSRLVGDLNDLTRLAQGRLELVTSPIDIRPSIMAAVETCLPLMHATRRTLHVELPDQPLITEGDPVRLQQVFSNLLANAERATRDGGDVEVTAMAAANGRAIQIAVRDTGSGIAPEKLPSIFALFAQDRPDSAQLGVGLALVKNLVELHGGRVQVESQGPEQGSVFTVTLRAAASSPVPASVADTGAARAANL
jgi:signal transduction histidine kinase